MILAFLPVPIASNSTCPNTRGKTGSTLRSNSRRKAKDRRPQERLQTLLLRNLEARLETVRDLARLSEQEMGFSTLFLAFGFLEWAQSENSAKEIYAPLLLLPVALETKLEAGKKIYSIHAASEAPEANITLIKHLEGDFNRALPDYDPDEDEDISVESYLEGRAGDRRPSGLANTTVPDTGPLRLRAPCPLIRISTLENGTVSSRIRWSAAS